MNRVRRVLAFVTPGGWTLLVLALAAYAGARRAGLGELEVVAVVALLLLALALPFVLVPTRVDARVALRPTHTVAGETGLARLHVTNQGPLPLLHPEVRLPIGSDGRRLRLPVLPSGRGRVVEVPVPTLRRGVIEVGPVAARRTDPLGLLQRTARWGTAAPLYVRPRMVALEGLAGGLLRDHEGSPSDEVSMEDLAFHALREYAHGDDLRHVHWRSSARAGQLLVRQYHQTRRQHATVLLDDAPASYTDADEFELAVSIAASLVLRATEEQADVSFVCGREVVAGRDAAAVLDACCRVGLDDHDLAERADAAARITAETTLLLVTGGPAGEERVRAAWDAFPGVVPGLVLRADHGEESRLSEDAARVARLEDLPGLLTRLVGVGR